MRFQPVAFASTRKEIGGERNGDLSAAAAARQRQVDAQRRVGHRREHSAVRDTLDVEVVLANPEGQNGGSAIAAAGVDRTHQPETGTPRFQALETLGNAGLDRLGDGVRRCHSLLIYSAGPEC